jgi:hypothetical protein
MPTDSIDADRHVERDDGSAARSKPDLVACAGKKSTILHTSEPKVASPTSRPTAPETHGAPVVLHFEVEAGWTKVQMNSRGCQ